MPTVTRLTSNGVFQSSGGFDEVSLNSGSIGFNRTAATDYFDVAKTNIGNLTGNPFTIECWVYLTRYGYLSSGGYVAEIFSSHATSGVGSNNGFEFNLQGTVSSWTSVGLYANNGALSVTYPYTFNLNTWYHVAVNRTSAGVFTIYVNGNSVGTTTNATGWTDYTPYGIAHSNLITYNYYLPAYISNYRIVVGSSIYNNNFIPSTSPLTAIANTKLLLLTNSQNPFGDSSGNNNTIIKNGNPIFNTLGPFYLPANTSINLANTNNNPILGSNTNIITSTTSNGVVMISNGFDEVSMSSQSLYFTGSPNYLSVPNTNIGNLTGNPFTIEAWIYLTAYPTLTNFYAAAIFTTTSTSSSNGGNFGLQFLVGGTASSYTSINVQLNNGTVSFGPSYSFLLRTWYHVALTRSSGGVFTLYVNGLSVGSTTNATGWTDNSPYAIGRNNQSGYEYYFPGNISNFRLNIGTPLYSANFAPPILALSSVANTKLLLNNFAAEPFVDNSGNNNTITINGGVTSNTLTPFANTQQKVLNTGTMMVGSYDEVVQGSLKFDGSTGYLSVPYTSSFDFGSDNFTIEFWFNPSTTGPGDGVLAIPHNTGNYSPVLIYWASSQVQLYSSSSGTSWDVAGGSAIGVGLSTNTWYHVAVSRSGPSIWTFLNGQLQQTINFAGTFTGTYDRVWIGDTTGNSNFNGLLSNIHVVKGTALYTVNFTPPRRSLLPVSNTVLLLNTTTLNPFVDNSGNNKIITVNGGVTSNSLCYF